MLTEGIVSQMSIFESIKNALQPEAIASKLGIDKHTLIDIGLYGAIGFIVGFLLKKYSEYFIAFVLAIIAILVLHQFDYISISLNVQKIHEMLGLPYIVTMMGNSYTSLFVEWVKSNIPGTASLTIGFLIGLKVG